MVLHSRVVTSEALKAELVVVVVVVEIRHAVYARKPATLLANVPPNLRRRVITVERQGKGLLTQFTKAK